MAISQWSVYGNQLCQTNMSFPLLSIYGQNRVDILLARISLPCEQLTRHPQVNTQEEDRLVNQGTNMVSLALVNSVLLDESEPNLLATVPRWGARVRIIPHQIQPVSVCCKSDHQEPEDEGCDPAT